MGDKILYSRVEDVPKEWIYEGNEYTHRIVTKKRQDSDRISFHITSYMPNFETEVVGDGIHEVVLYCLEGDSIQVMEDGREIHFTPGMAVYLPLKYTYFHKVGPNGLKVAVAASPPKE